ncbi:hypothetical protein XELAEV_18041945mg [Xenopus laevis]|uniref:Uncharacterized protein n=1 Tax=Xenopus laevis TaxID=8355 RepID=A0A974C3S4_XENLA|nr:hypothetical protein XELAEV_18041945mg [Xenopus laevis]
MGAKFAHSFANLYMGWWEETHISADWKKCLRVYIRNIDDLLCIWEGNVNLMSEGHRVLSTIYRKPSSGNNLLHEHSCHPKRLIGGIPVGQFLRLRRNCSSDKTFYKLPGDMRDRFQNDKTNIKQAFMRAAKTERCGLLRPKNHRQNRQFKDKYVGCTKRSLKERIREHISQISNINFSNTRHFREC